MTPNLHCDRIVVCFGLWTKTRGQNISKIDSFIHEDSVVLYVCLVYDSHGGEFYLSFFSNFGGISNRAKLFLMLLKKIYENCNFVRYLFVSL